MAMTREELEQAISKAKQRIESNKDERARFAFFNDFQGKITSDIFKLIETVTDLMSAGGYKLSDSPENVAGYWAVYCTSIAATLTAGAYFDTCVKIKFNNSGYENIKLTSSPKMMTTESLASIAGHALMQVMNAVHDLDVSPAGGGEYSQQLADTIEPLLRALLEAKEAKEVKARN